MSVVPLHRERPSSAPPSAASLSSDPSRRWIINSWLDQLLILSTPLLALPAVLALHAPLGLKAETISLVVTAFFATGHHFPGLIRAYGDSELFQRFRWRFLLAPPLLFLAYFPLQIRHPEFYLLVIVLWATWHGLMQLYGFVRIYDAKVGSKAPATAYWDWLVCVCGFVTAQFYSPARMSNVLGYWYSFGSPLIPPDAVRACRSLLAAVSIAVLIGFAVNYLVQWYRGPKPNPVKLLLLASGIGTWWLAVVYIENPLLGLALFDVCHDIQYLAIVWLYNCGRVRSNSQMGGFMRYVFRRGMVLLYLGLIIAYGAIGLVPALVQNGTIAMVFNGILGTSTLLHYYYDGFIWKVREKATQVSLGLNEQAISGPPGQLTVGGFAHLLKWSPLILAVGWLFTTDLVEPSLAQSRRDELSKRYAHTLMGRPVLPESDQERSWLYGQFEQAQNIAAAVPDDRAAQMRAALLLANFGQNDAAIDLLEDLLRQHPAFSDGHMALGGIELLRGDFEKATASFQAALAHATTADERANANLKLGEISLYKQDPASAKARMDDAVRDNPRLKASIEALRNRAASSEVSP